MARACGLRDGGGGWWGGLEGLCGVGGYDGGGQHSNQDNMIARILYNIKRRRYT